MLSQIGYDPFHWYWIVAGNEARFWSSATSAYVSQLPEDAGVTRIPSEQELSDVLAQYNLTGPLSKPYKLYRSDFIERMTNEEAGILELALSEAEAKLRLMYNSVEYFVSNDPLFAVLHMTVASILGTERADTLLRPKEGE